MAPVSLNTLLSSFQRFPKTEMARKQWELHALLCWFSACILSAEGMFGAYGGMGMGGMGYGRHAGPLSWGKSAVSSQAPEVSAASPDAPTADSDSGPVETKEESPVSPITVATATSAGALTSHPERNLDEDKGAETDKLNSSQEVPDYLVGPTFNGMVQSYGGMGMGGMGYGYLRSHFNSQGSSGPSEAREDSKEQGGGPESRYLYGGMGYGMGGMGVITEMSGPSLATLAESIQSPKEPAPADTAPNNTSVNDVAVSKVGETSTLQDPRQKKSPFFYGGMGYGMGGMGAMRSIGHSLQMN